MKIECFPPTSPGRTEILMDASSEFLIQQQDVWFSSLWSQFVTLVIWSLNSLQHSVCRQSGFLNSPSYWSLFQLQFQVDRY